MSEQNEACPCGSGNSYSDCCAPYLSGAATPPTAESLMRSRYTAHAKVDVPYLLRTLHPKTRSNFPPDSVQSFAENSDWQRLEILRTEKGGPEDTTGVVEFKAYFRDKKGPHIHHEVSDFEKINGTWFFKTGNYPKAQTILRTGKKIGRNDPCTCGSGKKYKKCCGK